MRQRRDAGQIQLELGLEQSSERLPQLTGRHMLCKLTEQQVEWLIKCAYVRAPAGPASILLHVGLVKPRKASKHCAC